MATVDELLIKIDASTELLRRELKRGADSMEKFERTTDKTVGGVAKRFKDFEKTVRASVGGFVAALGVRQVGRFTLDAIQAADAIAKAARTADIGGERFQRLQRVFELGGVETNIFSKAMQDLNRRLGQFVTTGGGPAAAAIKELGLEAAFTSGKIKTSEQLFDAFVERLEGVEGAGKAAALAAQLFGDEAGPKLVATLRLGRQGLAQAEQAITGVISDERLRQAEGLNDAFTRISNTLGNKMKSAAIGAGTALAQFFNVAESFTTVTELDEQIAKLVKRVELLQETLRTTGGGQLQLDQALADLDELVRRRGQVAGVAQLSDLTGVEIPAFERKPVETGPPREAALREVDISGFRRNRTAITPDAPPVPTGPFLSNAELDELEGKLFDLEQKTLRAQGQMAEAIRRAAAQQIAEWEKVAEGVPEAAGIAADAITQINEQAALEIAQLSEKAQKEASKFAEAFAAAFESRGVDALLNGDLHDAMRGFIDDIIELIVRLTILKPLAEAIEGFLSKDRSGEGDSGGGLGFLGKIFGGGIFGRASGGPVAGGRPYLVGEQGPELFVPGASGRIVNARQTAAGAGGMTFAPVFHVQAGLPPQWRAQLLAATDAAAEAAYEATSNRLRGRR